MGGASKSSSGKKSKSVPPPAAPAGAIAKEKKKKSKNGDAAPKKSRKSKRNKPPRDDSADDDSEEENEVQPTQEEQILTDDEGAGEQVEEEVDDTNDLDYVDKEGKTDKEIEDEAKAVAKSRAKKRGYRTVAKKAGFSAQHDSGLSHLDCSTPILSEAEVTRACKWMPKMMEKEAFGNIEEFKERADLSLQPLPPSAARVIRGNAEAYLRRLVVNAFQRASDQQKTGIKVAQVTPETRPLQRVQKYSFVAPAGLVRYAQKNPKPYRINENDNDKNSKTKATRSAIVKKQKPAFEDLVEKKRAMDKAYADAKAAKAAAAAAATAGA